MKSQERLTDLERKGAFVARARTRPFQYEVNIQNEIGFSISLVEIIHPEAVYMRIVP